MISRLVHYAADAVLVSTFLAGVKRTTGYTCVAARPTVESAE